MLHLYHKYFKIYSMKTFRKKVLGTVVFVLEILAKHERD